MLTGRSGPELGHGGEAGPSGKRRRRRHFGGAAALPRPPQTPACAVPPGRRAGAGRIRALGARAVPGTAPPRRQADRQEAAGEIRLVRRGDLRPAGAACGSLGFRRGGDHRSEDRPGGRERAVARRLAGKAGALVVVGGARLLPHRHGVRREGGAARALSRQAQPADRRRAPAGRHRRPHAGLSARGGQARARALGERADPGAQPSLRRSEPVARRRGDDSSDRRGRPRIRYFAARPHHRRPPGPCELQGTGTDLICEGPGLLRQLRTCKSVESLFAATPGREQRSMSDITSKPRTKVKLKTERPRLHKVILINDDYTPREFVVAVLKAEFRMNEDQAYRVMITAHRRGACVVAVFTQDVAESKATRATEAGRSKGYPLLFTTEPEE